MSELGHFKDKGLDDLANRGSNVAQFVSYNELGEQRYARVIGEQPNHQFDSEHTAITALLARTKEGKVNVRSFHPLDSKSKPFITDIDRVDDAQAITAQRRSEGLHTIINEGIQLDGGQISGVAFGNVIEFAPNDTPRCVEKLGTVQYTREFGSRIIHTVYGVLPTLPGTPDDRVEFSVYPTRRGYLDDHTVVWEISPDGNGPEQADTQWPNHFSNLLGDKTHGLLVAHHSGLLVPKTTVFNRSLAPFEFGTATGSSESWLRTAPNEQTPGKYTTTYGWQDPFALMQAEDPTGENIATILRQDHIAARYSGVTIMGADGQLIIEGTGGRGDQFMVGEKDAVHLPKYVATAVRDTYNKASSQLGPVRFEWVYDGQAVWVVQLHKGISASTATEIYPGNEDTVYIEYHTENGIEGLRDLIANLAEGQGIILVGNVGITSHLGDLLRKAGVPSKLQRKDSDNG